MSQSDLISDEEIQDFIDDRLDRRARSVLIARLLACPEIGADVEAMRRQQEALRQIGRETLTEPVPPRLRSILGREYAARHNGGGQGGALHARILGSTTAMASIFLGCVGGGF